MGWDDDDGMRPSFSSQMAQSPEPGHQEGGLDGGGDCAAPQGTRAPRQQVGRDRKDDSGQVRVPPNCTRVSMAACQDPLDLSRGSQITAR